VPVKRSEADEGFVIGLTQLARRTGDGIIAATKLKTITARRQ
jgi:hypothetical protein